MSSREFHPIVSCSYLTLLPWSRISLTARDDVLVVRQDRAAVAVRAEVLSGVEARARGDSDRSGGLPALACALRLRSILDDPNPLVAGDHSPRRRHRGHLPVEVHRYDRRVYAR